MKERGVTPAASRGNRRRERQSLRLPLELQNINLLLTGRSENDLLSDCTRHNKGDRLRELRNWVHWGYLRCEIRGGERYYLPVLCRGCEP